MMAQVARAYRCRGRTGAVEAVSVPFRGIGVMGEEIVVTGTVREATDGLATADSQAEQSGSRLIRNGVAEIVTP
jgi:hypothetical protein